MKLILIFSVVLIIGVCTYRLFASNEESQVQLTDYAAQLKESAVLKNEIRNTIKHTTQDGSKDTDSLSATLQNKSSLTNRILALPQSSEHASNIASSDARGYTVNQTSPEDETMQENRGIDTMEVQVSEAPAPEADYIATESISGLPIPSEETLQSTSKTDMR